jgi:hypothetical protein
MPSNTTTYSFQKPTVSGDADAWGGYLNANWDKTDDLFDGTTPVTGIDINSGAIDGTPIGANSASTGSFTTVTVTGDILTVSNADLDLAPAGTGKVVVRGNTNSGKIVLNCENNSHGVTLASPAHSAGATYEVALPNALGTVNASAIVTADANGDVTFPDGEKLKLGTSGDLEVYHNGSASYISDQGTGNLVLGAADSIIFQNAAHNENMLVASQNGAVTLYYDNAAKIATTSVGADVTGEFIADSYNETFVSLSGTTPTVDCHNGNVFALSTSGNTTFTFSNPPASGTAYGFMLKLTAGGTHTITWPGTVDWAGGSAPDAPASGETDILVFTTVDGGTNWYGALAIDAAG